MVQIRRATVETGRSMNELKVYFASRRSRTYRQITYGDGRKRAVIGFQLEQVNRPWCC